MENLYLYFTVTVAAVSLASLSLYDPSAEKGYRLALGVILTAALFTPGVSAVKKLSSIEFDSTGEKFESVSLSKTLEGALSDGIREALAEEFLIDEESIGVELVGFDPDKMSAEKIKVTLFGTAAFGDIVAVEKFVSELGLGECALEVRVGREK